MLATAAQHKLGRATTASSAVSVTIRKRPNCSGMSEEENSKGRFEIEESAEARAAGAQWENRLGGRLVVAQCDAAMRMQLPAGSGQSGEGVVECASDQDPV